MADVGAETLAAGAGQVPKPADTPPAVPDYKVMPTPPAMPTGGGGPGIPQAGLRDALNRYSTGVQGAQDRLRTASYAIDNLKPPEPAKMPPAPQPHSTDFMSAFGSAAMALAGLGSLMTRQPLVNALNAGTAVLNAYHQNDMAEAQLQFKQWQTAVQNAEHMQRFEQQAYSAALAKARLQPELARAEMTTLAASFKDQVVHSMVSKGDLSGAANILMGRSKALGSMVTSSGEIAWRHQIGEKIRAARAANDPEAVHSLLQEYATHEFEKTGKLPPGMEKLILGGKGVDKPPTVAGLTAQAVEAKSKDLIAKQEKMLGRPLTDAEKADIQLGQIRESRPLTPGQDLQLTETYNNVRQTLTAGDHALRTLMTVPGVAGVGGKIMRPAEAIGNVFGSNTTARSDFLENLRTMQLHYESALRVTGGRPLAADLKIVSSLFDSSGWGRTTANVMSAIEHIQQEMVNRRQDLVTRYPYLTAQDRDYPTLAAPGRAPAADPAPGGGEAGLDPSQFQEVKP